MMKCFLVVFSILAVVSAKSVENFIYKGDVAKVGQFPYTVGVITHGVTKNTLCGGSLLSNNYVLTTGNCMLGRLSAFAILGALRAQDPKEEGQVRILCEKFVFHEKFQEKPDIYDLAILTLSRPVQYNERIQPIRLPSWRQVQQTFVGQETTIVGWGRFKGSQKSQDLRFGKADIIGSASCKLSLPTSYIDPLHICTTGAVSSPCLGDNGAPVTILEADLKPTQLGVYIFGSVLGCEGGRAAVHVKLTSHLQWIQENSDVKIRDE